MTHLVPYCLPNRSLYALNRRWLSRDETSVDMDGFMRYITRQKRRKKGN